MSLPHVLLGLLHGEPQTGYDLARAIREEMDPEWRAGFSQIYPALARLRRQGWVLLRVLGPRYGPRRLLYRVTAAGRRELARWLAEPPPPPRGNDPALLRLALLDALPPGDRRRALAAAEEAVAAEVERVRRLPPASGSRAFARRAAVARHEALRRLLRSARARPPAPSASRGAARKKR
ncbi:MAG TPA: PadR family transcriptional regulator [Thermoanaerobaculia bacterium]|nr:PadR family transcriptional regulator [Thermoanaerobaculia bacterium]